MNLRNAKSYHIGLDLGTGSVGWAVVDDDGWPFHFNGKPTMGSRLFPSAETAAGRRGKRGQRRRYNRRRQRIDYLQKIFMPAMNEVDPAFFVRMKQSSLWAEDKGVEFAEDKLHALFNGTDFTEKEYYAKYPTIWHLRSALMNSSEKMDIRLIYLALHNIVKYRGNFLHEGEEGLSAANSNASQAVQGLCEALISYIEENAVGDSLDTFSCDPDLDAMLSVFEDVHGSRGAKTESLQNALGCSDAKFAKALAKACFGYKTEYSNLFFNLEKQEGTNFEINDDEKVDSFLEICPDEAMPLFDAIRSCYSAYVLGHILRGQNSISGAMIASYEQHQHDLKIVKRLVKEYCGMETYRFMFRGPRLADGRYDISKLPKNSYTAYIAGEKLSSKKGCTQEDFIKKLRSVLDLSEFVELESDEGYQEIKDRLWSEDFDFLTKQKTRANGAIPYQLHLEEMSAIIDAQGEFYPFLLEQKDQLEKIVKCRIPYYVGPLNTSVPEKDRKFGWSTRKEGMDGVEVYPWNVDEVIDTDETAEKFITRMTGTCTYLYDEPVLPRCSLLYEEFCVLNELNGARWGYEFSNPHRFVDPKDRYGIVEDLFQKHKTVTFARVQKWLLEHHNALNAKVVGAQGEDRFVSKLNSYNDFCDILKVDDLEDAILTIDEIEEIILWNTVFEDRQILMRKIEQKYGDRLDASQIKKIVKKRYTGWGRLSHKLLVEMKIDTVDGPRTIMDFMRDGSLISGHIGYPMLFQEIIHEKRFGFEEEIKRINDARLGEQKKALSVDKLLSSPANRRTVKQAMRIVEEIVSIVGHQPTSICIETTRSDGEKGKRTTTRYDNLKQQLKVFKAEASLDPEILKQLDSKKGFLDDERLYLYFAQGGKSLYSGKTLDINRLSEYQVDHIIPRAYFKDDSFDNKALVLQEENQRKLDSLLLDDSIVKKQTTYWRSLLHAGLISPAKYGHLTCKELTDRKLNSFSNRQLVETGQIVKCLRDLCAVKYPSTDVIGIKATLSQSLRGLCGVPKCRAANNYHHAHDAYLACSMARYLNVKFPGINDGLQASYIRKFMKQKGLEFNKSKDDGKYGFIVDSFCRNSFNGETGEVLWDAQEEIEKIVRVVSYKDIFISKMPIESTENFWKETIYSPYQKTKLIPVKGRDLLFGDRRNESIKQGGYIEEKQAFFCIFKAKERAKEKVICDGVPVSLISQIRNLMKKDGAKETDLVLYLQKYLPGYFKNKYPKLSEITILRSRLMQNTLIDINGVKFYLGGKKTNETNHLSNATELAFNRTQLNYISSILKEEEDNLVIIDSEFIDFLIYILTKAEDINPFLFKGFVDSFDESLVRKLSSVEKREVLQNLLEVISAQRKSVSFKSMGIKTNPHDKCKKLGAEIENLVIIDQSPSGMFETRTTYQDMINGI